MGVGVRTPASALIACSHLAVTAPSMAGDHSGCLHVRLGEAVSWRSWAELENSLCLQSLSAGQLSSPGRGPGARGPAM